MSRARLTEAELAEELLTPGQVAHLLGVDPKTVTRWAREGRIAHIKTPGGHRRYRRVDIDRLTTLRETPAHD